MSEWGPGQQLYCHARLRPCPRGVNYNRSLPANCTCAKAYGRERLYLQRAPNPLRPFWVSVSLIPPAEPSLSLAPSRRRSSGMQRLFFAARRVLRAAGCPFFRAPPGSCSTFHSQARAGLRLFFGVRPIERAIQSAVVRTALQDCPSIHVTGEPPFFICQLRRVRLFCPVTPFLFNITLRYIARSEKHDMSVIYFRSHQASLDSS